MEEAGVEVLEKPVQQTKVKHEDNVDNTGGDGTKSQEATAESKDKHEVLLGEKYPVELTDDLVYSALKNYTLAQSILRQARIGLNMRPSEFNDLRNKPIENWLPLVRKGLETDLKQPAAPFSRREEALSAILFYTAETGKPFRVPLYHGGPDEIQNSAVRGVWYSPSPTEAAKYSSTSIGEETAVGGRLDVDEVLF